LERLSRRGSRVITAFTPVMALGHHYKISGKQINGLSQACCYGDDAQMGTNYPLARFTNNGSGAIAYFRTFDFSTLAVATGAAIHDTLVRFRQQQHRVTTACKSSPMALRPIPVGREHCGQASAIA